jgi:hypothetical protein
MAWQQIVNYAIFHTIGGKVSISVYFPGGSGNTALMKNLTLEEARLVIDILRNEKPVYLDEAQGRISTGPEPVGEGENH